MTTAAQRLAALDAANQVRVDRAKLRRVIKSGEMLAHQALEDMPECLRGCGVFQFLTFLPDVARKTQAGSTSKAFVLLRKANATQVGHKRLGDVTPAQLERITRVVREYEAAKHPSERGLC